MKKYIYLLLPLVSVANISHAKQDCFAGLQARIEIHQKTQSASGSSFHSAMCDKTLDIEEKGKSNSGGANFSVGGYGIGASQASAKSYRSAYQRSMCGENKGESNVAALSDLSAYLPDPRWADVAKECMKLQKGGVFISPRESSNFLFLDIEIDPGIDQPIKVTDGGIDGIPKSDVNCSAKRFKDGAVLNKGYYAASCERSKNIDAFITVSSNVGNYTYFWPKENDIVPTLQKEIVELKQKLIDSNKKNQDLMSILSPVLDKWLWTDKYIVELLPNGTHTKGDKLRGEWQCNGVRLLWDTSNPKAEHWDDRLLIKHGDDNKMVGENRKGNPQTADRR